MTPAIDRSLLLRLLFMLISIVIILLITLPFIWCLLTSFKSNQELYSSNPLSLINLTFDNYRLLWNSTQFFSWIYNSLKISTISTLLSLMVAIPAAFAFSRFRFRGISALRKLVLLSYLMPSSLLFIPLYNILASIGLIDSHLALIFVYPSFLAPFTTWLLIGYFNSIPKSLEELALLEGCNYVTTILKITLPLAALGILSTGMISLTLAWGEYLYALIFINSDALKTITTGIASLESGDVFNWGLIMSAGILSSIPPILILFLVRRYTAIALPYNRK